MVAGNAGLLQIAVQQFRRHHLDPLLLGRFSGLLKHWIDQRIVVHRGGELIAEGNEQGRTSDGNTEGGTKVLSRALHATDFGAAGLISGRKVDVADLGDGQADANASIDTGALDMLHKC